ncbi:hypothetical protein H257_11367 [Aphanomyces astaci]|uniref:Uncharacterized protein n=1 Tax=Aphanomyces astaci TaxID=112090 RepID=W4G309_APHAT|nr:hypothetical protein H257_11367 [Aphanomyces astaci]ETV74055.1 hypothetical protein H257_11367 [Aphanomyces astaci]|eukprot:XP_009836568.1 hypothetical protein H257_11367 [Aphanomyces astaci]
MQTLDLEYSVHSKVETWLYDKTETTQLWTILLKYNAAHENNRDIFQGLIAASRAKLHYFVDNRNKCAILDDHTRALDAHSESAFSFEQDYDPQVVPEEDHLRRYVATLTKCNALYKIKITRVAVNDTEPTEVSRGPGISRERAYGTGKIPYKTDALMATIKACPADQAGAIFFLDASATKCGCFAIDAKCTLLQMNTPCDVLVMKVICKQCGRWKFWTGENEAIFRFSKSTAVVFELLYNELSYIEHGTVPFSALFASISSRYTMFGGEFVHRQTFIDMSWAFIAAIDMPFHEDFSCPHCGDCQWIVVVGTALAPMRNKVELDTLRDRPVLLGGGLWHRTKSSNRAFLPSESLQNQLKQLSMTTSTHTSTLAELHSFSLKAPYLAQLLQSTMTEQDGGIFFDIPAKPWSRFFHDLSKSTSVCNGFIMNPAVVAAELNMWIESKSLSQRARKVFRDYFLTLNLVIVHERDDFCPSYLQSVLQRLASKCDLKVQDDERFHLMTQPESPETLFSIFYSRFPDADRVVIYDNACNYHEYCINRKPQFFANQVTKQDRIHAKGHVGCTIGHNLDEFWWAKAVNTQVAEQGNALLDGVKKQSTFMTIGHYALFVWFVLANMKFISRASTSALGTS